MLLDRDEIVRLRTANQGISAPMGGGPAEIVRWLVAVQVQDYAGAKWGLGLRLRGVGNEQAEQAFSAWICE